jgi:8-oxo-dGTP pyrophosphatase MutT (NUDIX family)
MSRGPVVVILPIIDQRILMQLRDQKESIVFPGQWGFFGGSIDADESPLVAAKRELLEELQLSPPELLPLGPDEIEDLGNLLSYAYCFKLKTNLSDVQQLEGTDMRLSTVEEIRSGRIFSERLNSWYPVVPSNYIARTAEKALIRSNQ